MGAAGVFAAEDKNAPAEGCRDNAAAHRWDRSPCAPAVAGRVVFFVVADAAIVITVDASGDNIEFIFDDADGDGR